MHIGELLEMCSNNENVTCFCRNVLCARTKTQNSCSKGNPMNRKSTKSNSSAQKYARDYYTLHMFIQGEAIGVEQGFDIQKCNGTDVSQINMWNLGF